MLLARIFPPTISPQPAAPVPDSSTRTDTTISTSDTGMTTNVSYMRQATHSTQTLAASDPNIVISVSASQSTTNGYDLARAFAVRVQRDLFFEGLIKSLETAVQKPGRPYDSLIIAPLSQTQDAPAQVRETVMLQRAYR